MTQRIAACQVLLSSRAVSQRLLKFMSIESVMLSNHPPLLPSSPCVFNFPSIRVFSNDSVLHIRWPKYWSFSFSISPSNEYSGLFSFRMDWFDLHAVQGTLKGLLQHHHSKASILCTQPALQVVPEWSSGFPYFLQFKSEFGNKEFMI